MWCMRHLHYCAVCSTAPTPSLMDTLCSIRTLYADCLLIHDSLRNLVIRIKSVCTWKIIRFQSESEKEMNVATREVHTWVQTLLDIEGIPAHCTSLQCGRKELHYHLDDLDYLLLQSSCQHTRLPPVMLSVSICHKVPEIFPCPGWRTSSSAMLLVHSWNRQYSFIIWQKVWLWRVSVYQVMMA